MHCGARTLRRHCVTPTCVTYKRQANGSMAVLAINTLATGGAIVFNVTLKVAPGAAAETRSRCRDCSTQHHGHTFAVHGGRGACCSLPRVRFQGAANNFPRIASAPTALAALHGPLCVEGAQPHLGLGLGARRVGTPGSPRRVSPTTCIAIPFNDRNIVALAHACNALLPWSI